MGCCPNSHGRPLAFILVSMRIPPTRLKRRKFLEGSLAAAGASLAAFVSAPARGAPEPVPLNLQLGWAAGITQAGEIVAKRLGYYAEEGLALNIQAGGPTQDGVAMVASGHAELGQLSSSPSLLLAVAQGLPIRCFAVGAQRHPFCFFSLSARPVRKPADLRGKRIGLTPGALVLLRALLARNGMSEKDVKLIPTVIGTQLLLTGQADVVTGWTMNAEVIRDLDKNVVQMALWDTGVRMYGLPYYASPHTLQARRRDLEGFLRASARGWHRAFTHRDEAIGLMVKEYPRLAATDLRTALDSMLDFSFGGPVQKVGWGAMDPTFWTEQIALLAATGQLSRVPATAEVMTLELLDATRQARLRAD
ncbi:MAG: ABC transporter substrate-binding protein [Burkholderiales bacterium]